MSSVCKHHKEHTTLPVLVGTVYKFLLQTLMIYLRGNPHVASKAPLNTDQEQIH